MATLVTAPPRSNEWRYEIKFDGYRILTRIEDDQISLFTRNGHDWTNRLTRLADEFRSLNLKNAWIDGEVVALDEDGKPSFSRLQRAFDSRDTTRTHYYAFDLMYFDQWDLRPAALEDRQALLTEVLESDSSIIRISEPFDIRAPELLDAVCKMLLEGLIGKRLGSPYTSGRSKDWVKLKCLRTQDFAIGGFTTNRTVREQLGALLLGEFDAKLGLRYVGRVGTGFTQSQGRAIVSALKSHQRPEMPFQTFKADRRFGGSKSETVIWVDPIHEIPVIFTDITEDGHIRHASIRSAALRRRA